MYLLTPFFENSKSFFACGFPCVAYNVREVREVNKMPLSEARKRANKKYSDAHLDAMRFDAPKGFKERVRAAAERAGVSPSTYMRDAIIARMEQDEQVPKE